MMTKNYISIILLAAISALCLNTISAQEKKESHKVIMIEKTVDENGNVTENKVVKEGQEAKDYIKEMNIEGEENIWISKDGEEIDQDGKAFKMLKKEHYKIITQDDDGNEKVVEWNGEGEMPDEIKNALEEADIEIHEGDGEHQMDVEIKSDGDSKKSMIKIMKSSDGDSKEYEFVMEGEDVPEDVKKLLEKEGIDLKVFEDAKSGDKRIMVFTDEEGTVQKKTEEEKAQLGVYLVGEEGGVKIEEIMKGTAAEEAGLKVGDIITAINDERVMSVQELVGAITEKKVGDVIKVNFLRGNKNEEVSIELKAKKEMYKINWDNMNESPNKRIQKKVIIKKEK